MGTARECLANKISDALLIRQTRSLQLTVRPFLRWFRRYGSQSGIQPCREAQQLENPLLDRMECRHMANGLFRSLDDRDRDGLKRFEQPLGGRASRFPLGIAGLETGQLGSVCRQLTAHDKFPQR